MPNEIINTLGFDVADALAALVRLDAQFAAFGNRLGSTAAQISAFNTSAANTVASLRKVATQATATNAALSKMGNVNAALGMAPQVKSMQEASQLLGKTSGSAFAVMGDQARTAASSVAKAKDEIQYATLTWQTFSRIVQTQALIRGFGMIRDAVTESFQSFKDFSKQVGEIAAINPERSFGQIADSVRRMSDAFNQPLDRTAEATYQVISDQFVTLTEQTNILTASNQLAKTGAEDLAASAQLLTGALNAYGESSDMAGLRSAQFFETIKLGRLRAGELGTALGRIQSIGHELGVSMEELDSSLVAITIGGVKASEAATQIRGVMSGLLKPSEEMKKAFKAIGVESGTAAVATYGFQGTLEALWNAIGGDKASAAKLFPNIRGLAGDFRLAGSGAEKFKQSMEALARVDATTLAKSFEQFTSSDIEKLTKELNQIKNFFTADFGKQLAEQLGGAIKMLGGAGGAITALKVLTGDLPKDLAAIGIYAGAAAAAVTIFGRTSAAAGGQMTLFNTQTRLAATNLASLRGALTGIILLELGRMAGQGIGNWINSSIEAPWKRAREQLEEHTKIRAEQAAAATRIEQTSADEMFKGLRQLVAKSNVEYLKDVENYRAASDRIVKITQTAFDEVLQARKKLTQDLMAASEEAAKNAAGVGDTRSGLKQEQTDLLFNQRAKQFDPSGQFGQYAQAFRQAANEYERLQGMAKDDQEQKLADAALRRAESYKSMAQSAAQSSGNATAIKQAENLDLELIQRKDVATKRWGQTQAQVADQMEAQSRKSKESEYAIEEKALELHTKLKALVKDDEGDRPSDAAFAKGLAEYRRLVEEFKRNYGQTGQSILTGLSADPRAFESMKRSIDRAIGGASIREIELAPDAINGLRDKLKAAYDRMVGSHKWVVDLEFQTGLRAFEVGFDKIIDAAAKKINDTLGAAASVPFNKANLTESLEAYKAARDKLVAGIAPLAGINIRGSLNQRSPSDANAINDERAKIASVTVELDRMSQSSTVTEAQMAKLNQTLDTLDWTKAFGGRVAGEDAKQQIDTMLRAIERLKTSRDTLNKAPSTQEFLDAKRLQGQINQVIEKPAVADPLQKSAQSANNLTSALSSAASINYSSLISQLNSAATAMGKVATAASRIPNMGASYAASGGMMYFDHGGFARGTDTQMAALTRGEMVVNAASSRRWFSQLTAMNAGMSPVYRSEGGPVTNAGIVGDVSVTVNGGSKQTGRDVVAAINREIRRGSCRLRN